MGNSGNYIAISFVPASFWKRVYSNAIDYIGPFIICLFGAINPYFAFTDIIPFMLGIGFLLAIVIWLVSIIRLGNTLGRQWVGIGIIDQDGNVPSPWKLAIREILKLISICPPLTIGFLLIIWDKRKQTWYDKVTKTYVIVYSEQNTDRSLKQSIEEPTEYTEDMDIISRLSPPPPEPQSTQQETPGISLNHTEADVKLPLEVKSTEKIEPAVWAIKVSNILNIISSILILCYGLIILAVWDSEGIIMSIISFILAVLLLTGGIFVILRRRWAIAFASSVMTSIFLPILGITALIFTILSNRNWSKVKRSILIGITIVLGYPWAWLMTIALLLTFNK